MYKKLIATELDNLEKAFVEAFFYAAGQYGEVIPAYVLEYMFKTRAVMSSVIAGQLPAAVIFGEEQSLDFVKQYSEQLADFINEADKQLYIHNYIRDLKEKLDNYLSVEDHEHILNDYLSLRKDGIFQRQAYARAGNNVPQNFDYMPYQFIENYLTIKNNLSDNNFLADFEAKLSLNDKAKILFDVFITKTKLSLGQIPQNIINSIPELAGHKIDLSINTLLKFSGYIENMNDYLLSPRHSHAGRTADMYNLILLMSTPIRVLEDISVKEGDGAAKYLLVLNALDSNGHNLILPIKPPDENNANAYVPTVYGAGRSQIENPKRYKTLFPIMEHFDIDSVVTDYEKYLSAEPQITEEAKEELLRMDHLQVIENSYTLRSIQIIRGGNIFLMYAKDDTQTIVGILVWEYNNFVDYTGSVKAVKIMDKGAITAFHKLINNYPAIR